MKTGNVLSNPAARVGLGLAFVLLLSLVATLITDEVVWSFGGLVLIVSACVLGVRSAR